MSVMRILARALPVALLFPCGPAAAAQPPVLGHVVEASFDLDAHAVTLRDRLTVPPGLEFLRLGAGLDYRIVSAPAANGGAVGIERVEAGPGEGGPWQRLDLAAAGLAQGGELVLEARAVFHAPVDQVAFSRENIGGEIVATISAEGIYLSSMSGWLASADGAFGTYDLSLETPAGYETLTQGRLVERREEGGRLHTRWRSDDPSDSMDLVANRFVVTCETIREGLESCTYLLSDDEALRATYLERTRAYIAMYEEMIGPYPYAKFATVENWFATGYGMPSWTLLGSQVLRLPFIPYTSFGHEIAHNWWGNSVFVDPAEGNWCEGLTTWCADYHYKELEGPAAAREYRRNLLKDYAAYVADPAKDFPLSEFRSRHSGATRAVGYGKSMMVFHMADRLAGRERFLAALREVAAAHRFRAAGWSDFLDAFALDDAFAAQWLERTGAPSLALADVEFGSDTVTFRLRQAEPAYSLAVPVTVTAADGSETGHVVRLEATDAAFTLPARGAVRLAIDPDCHLFRRLDPAEIEPTISQVFGSDRHVFVVDGPTGPLAGAARAFARAFTESDSFAVVDGGLPADDRTAVVLNPGPDLLARLGAPGLTVSGRTLFLDGRRYSLDATDLVYAAVDPRRPGATVLVVLCGSPERLPGLAGRVSHYGRHSWLALPAGQGRPERGNWQAGDSPLLAVR
jgi:plasmid stabilization system protein ParE